jgi:glycolate oxidase FAD binding subunit
MYNELAAIVGKEWVHEGAAVGEYAVDGLLPRMIVRPGSVEELAEILRRAHEAGWIVVPAGNGTGLSLGNPLERMDLVISTLRLHQVLDYEPADLTASVQAGCTLEKFNQGVGEHNQWLPLDPPEPHWATLGAVVAVGDVGPMRVGFGLARDYVIGLQVVQADGTQIKTGGRVVKNVAGYDLNKLFVGSLGTLGIITQLNFKLRPRPETEATCAVLSNDDATLSDFVRLVTASELSPAAMLYLSFRTALRLSLPCSDMRPALLVRFMDSEPAVRYQVDRLKEMVRMCDLNVDVEQLPEQVAEPFRRSIRDFVADPQSNLVIRINALPSEVNGALTSLAWVQDLPGERYLLADQRSGVARMQTWVEPTGAACEKVAERLRGLRREFQRMNGSLVIERAPVELKRRMDVWGEVGPTARIMRALKQQFDPRRILNPGRFVAGI